MMLRAVSTEVGRMAGAPTTLIVGGLLSLVYMLLAPSAHPFSHDGRELYVGGRVWLAHGNPYKTEDLQHGYARFSPEGPADAERAMPQVQLPGTLLMVAAFGWIPWAMFWRLQVCLTAMCIPLIARECLLLAGRRPTLLWIILGSVVIAALPPTWQNIALGQLTALVLLAALMVLRKSGDGMAPAAACTVLALAKVTCTAPMLLFAAVAGEKNTRRGILAGTAIFALLNIVAVARIGVDEFGRAYAQEVREVFQSGGHNDLHGVGQGARVDLASLLAPLNSDAAETAMRVVLGSVLVLAWLNGQKPRRPANLADAAVVSMLGLSLFYHRTYDAVLLAPALIYVFTCGERPAWRWVFLLGMLALAMATIGEHNVLDLVLTQFGGKQPPFLRALAVFGSMVALILAVRTRPEPVAEVIGVGWANKAPVANGGD